MSSSGPAVGSTVVRAVLSMVVRPGGGPRFEAIWAAAATEISRRPGHRGQSLARDAAQEHRYVITSDWASAQALRDFEASAERRALSAALGELRESAEKSVLTVITTVSPVSEVEVPS